MLRKASDRDDRDDAGKPERVNLAPSGVAGMVEVCEVRGEHWRYGCMLMEISRDV